MLGSDSTCFMLRLMMRANLYASSSCSILFHRRTLMLTVIRLGVLSIIASIISFLLFSFAKIYPFPLFTKRIHHFFTLTGQLGQRTARFLCAHSLWSTIFTQAVTAKVTRQKAMTSQKKFW